MSKHSHLLKKITTIIDKQAASKSLGLSFRIQLNGEPDVCIRTRGFNDDGNNLQLNPIQNEEAPNE